MRRNTSLVILSILLGLLLALCVVDAQASVSHKHQNGLGVVISDDNPYIYLMGLPVDSKVFEDNHRIYTNIAVRPYGTDMLHTEQLLLCGNETVSFDGMTGVLVITYRREASYSAGGVGCHDLLKVFQVELPKLEPPIQQEGR